MNARAVQRVTRRGVILRDGATGRATYVALLVQLTAAASSGAISRAFRRMPPVHQVLLVATRHELSNGRFAPAGSVHSPVA